MVSSACIYQGNIRETSGLDGTRPIGSNFEPFIMLNCLSNLREMFKTHATRNHAKGMKVCNSERKARSRLCTSLGTTRASKVSVDRSAAGPIANSCLV